jgi:2',3'-cyclic-nucleotide 2'-phosphodiesterase (5'-nucleotidase family)
MGPGYECDTILPLQHLYVPDDHITCRDFDFPVILSGHDHHRVDEIVEGTRLLKPGMDAIYATVLEMIWADASSDSNPKIKATFVKTSDWEPDPVLAQENDRAYDVLEPLRNTELASVPMIFQPLSSVNSRGSVTTMGRYINTLLRSSMNLARRQRDHQIDAVLLMGGNIRGGQDYNAGSFFSLEALEAEIKSDEVVAVVPMPGW